MAFWKKNSDRHFTDSLNSGFLDLNISQPNGNYTGAVMVKKCDLDDFNNRSKILVNAGELAVLLHNGHVTGMLKPGLITVSNSNHPFLTNLVANLIRGGARAQSDMIFFIRNTATDVIWTTADTQDVPDPAYGYTNVAIGACIKINLTVRPEHMDRFFNSCVGATERQLTYGDIINKASTTLNNDFFSTVISCVNRAGNIDSVNAGCITPELYPAFKKSLLEKYGITVLELSVVSLNKISSDERNLIIADRRADLEKEKARKELYKDRKLDIALNSYEEDVKREARLKDSHQDRYLRTLDAEADSEIRIKTSDTDDYVERQAALREAARITLLKEAEAAGSLKEIEVLGPNWMKIKIEEITRTAMSNPAIANMATSALGGYLGSQSNVLSDLCRGLVDAVSPHTPAQPAAAFTGTIDCPTSTIDPMAAVGVPPVPADIPEPQGTTETSPADLEAQISKLNALHDKGLISEKVYQDTLTRLISLLSV